jgi:hypothetical protein
MAPTLWIDPGFFRDGRHHRRRVAPGGKRACIRPCDAHARPASGSTSWPPSEWHRWNFEWTATPGVHDIASRATDATGATQPLQPEFNLGGYENNAVHRLRVTVPES